jgi:PAS domain S-box-containing protein
LSRGGFVFRRPAWFAADGAPHPLAGLAVGIVMAVLATVLRAGCDPILGSQAPFLLHIPAVVVASWFGGLPAGAAAAIPSAFLVDFFFIEPRLTTSLFGSDRSAAMLLFVIVCLGLAWRVGRWRASERALRLTRDDAARNAAELRAVIEAVPAAVFATRRPQQPAVPINHLAEVLAGAAAADGGPPRQPVRFATCDGTVDIASADLPVQRAAATGIEVRDQEFSAIYDDGSVRTLFGTGVPLRDEFGRVRGGVGAFLDITERKRAEAVLHRYELLAHHARDIMLFIRRGDGRIVEANAAAERAYGYTREELLARTIHDLRPAEDAGAAQALMADADVAGILFEARHRRQDGSLFPVEVSSRGMTVGGDRVLVSVIRDITERSQAEQSLRESERRTLAVLNAVTESIWLLDRDGRVLLASATAAERVGVRPGEAVGRLLYDLLPAGVAASRRRHFDEVIRTGEPVQFEDERAGLVFHHTLYPVRDGDGRVSGVAVFSRDHTARHRAEAQVERLNAQLRTRVTELERLLALTPVGVAIAEDPQCRVMRANAALQRLLGVPPETNISVTAPVRPPWRICRDGRALSEDELPLQRCAAHMIDVPPEECDLVFDDGRVVNLLVSATPLQQDDGRPGGCIGVLVDITDHKRIERALISQAEHLQLQAALLSNAHDAIIVRDADARITFWNTGAERMYGWTEAEVLGRNVYDVLAPDREDVGRIRDALDTAREWQGDQLHRRKDGSTVIVDSRQVVVETESAADVILEINRDISDRMRAEDQRAQLMARLAVLLEVSESLSAAATPDEIVEILLEKAVAALGAYAGSVAVLSNDGTEVQILGSRGYPVPVQAAFARMPITMPTPLTDAIRTQTTVVVASPEEWRARYPALVPDRVGTQSRALAAIPLRGSRIVGAIGLSFRDSRDLSSRDSTFAALLGRQAAQALERAQLLVSERLAHAEVEQASRIKDEFLATLSHELRTPLNAILGWSHMLLGDAIPEQAQRHAVEVIARNATSQVRLVDEVLDISRIVRGQLQLDLQVVDVRAAIERALDTVRPAADAKELTLVTNLSDDLATVADAERLQQVVWNLLSNAVKFTPRGGRVAVSATRHRSQAVIEVHDTGPGIPPEFLPHVFERFTQADSSTTRRYGGLGLGLAIVRHIVELHGGTVRVESAGENAGSRFIVALPLRSNAAADTGGGPGTVAPSVPVEDVAALAGVTVLVVDDEHDARDVLQAMLAAAGASVVLASSAQEALAVLRGAAPHVLISDIGMAAEDGYALIRQVRALPGELGRVPALALTAYGHPADRAHALASGFDQHLVKPIRPRDLVTLLTRLLGRQDRSAPE